MMLYGVSCCAQIKKDTVIYNYIYKDTVIYVNKAKENKEVDLSNWGIGPYAGIDYSYSPQYGEGVWNYSFGFGVSYYIYRFPNFKKKSGLVEKQRR